MNNLHKLILEKIKKEEIRPIPKWQFILLNIIMWGSVVVSVLLGGLAFGVVLDVIFGAEWSIVDKIAHGRMQGFFMILPYLWVLVLFLAGIMTWKVFLHTRSGYRYTPKKIFTGILILSVVGGAVLWQTKISRHADRWALESIPPELHFTENIKNRIFNPEGGVLGGVVIKYTDREVILRDIFGKDWQVNIDNIDKLPEQRQVLFFGEQIGENMFMAEQVLTPRGMRPDSFRPKKMKEIIENVRTR